MATVGFGDHDHTQCISDALDSARAHCTANGLQFTQVRQRVLEILLAEHKAMGAYDILPILAEEKLGSQPPVVYRALSFLVKNGFAHRIEALNAYIACAHLGRRHAPAFLICRSCKTIAETDADIANSHLNDAAKQAGFVIDRVVVEAEGLCPACAA